MVDEISGLGNYSSLAGMQGMEMALAAQAARVSGEAGSQKVKEEFLAIFYKELLKQAFKAPKLGVGEDDVSFTSSFSSDILVEKLALELARSGAFSAQDILPSEIGR